MKGNGKKEVKPTLSGEDGEKILYLMTMSGLPILPQQTEIKIS